MQRCLYAYAVRALVAGADQIEARLFYVKADVGGLHVLENPGDVLVRLAKYVNSAQLYAQAGNLLPRAGAEETFNDLESRCRAAPKRAIST